MDIPLINNVTGHLNAPAEPTPVHQPAHDQRSLVQAVKAINASEMLGPDDELTFLFDRATRQAVVRLVNKQTREVIRQIPAEYVLRMAEETKRG